MTRDAGGGGRSRRAGAEGRSSSDLGEEKGAADGNRLLRALPREALERLAPELDEAEVVLGQSVCEQGHPVQHAYFPHTGVFSLINLLDGGKAVEVATIGSEGMVGVPLVLGGESMPSRCFCQIAGKATRIRAAAFREALRTCPDLRALMLRYAQALLSQVVQSAACNRSHSIEQRCARWLLITHDRVGRGQFKLTQEFLAEMLGVRRPSVTVAAGMLQKAGLIRYSRGLVAVLDREGLEAASCPCYGVVRAEFDRLLGR